MFEVFTYSAVIGLGLGIGLKTAEGIVAMVDAFTVGLMCGSKITKENWTRNNYPRGNVVASAPTTPPPPKPVR
jgi:hypothetical protein